MALLLRWFEPLGVAGALLLWSLLPADLARSGMVFLGVTMAGRVALLGLEWLAERHAGWRLNRQELLTDLFYLLLGNTVIQFGNEHLTDAGLLAIKKALGISTPWLAALPVAVQILIAVFVVELAQYWLHRAMHNWRPLWLVHAPHHHLTQLNALKGGVGNPIELLLVFASAATLLDFSLPALLGSGAVLIFVSCCAHANVRFNPPRWYGFFFTTVEHHSLHHSVAYQDTRCNYANVLICLDRLFGSFRVGEAAVVGQDDRRRLSIWEQFLFPWLPAINGRYGAVATPKS
ncbi:MAG: sterol desaturase family protein [Sphingomonadales bacterium]|jgi:sterol desaturase/sphingolipid hydroxylase (fatty acid hydroxylase superfamily)